MTDRPGIAVCRERRKEFITVRVRLVCRLAREALKVHRKGREPRHGTVKAGKWLKHMIEGEARRQLRNAERDGIITLDRIEVRERVVLIKSIA